MTGMGYGIKERLLKAHENFESLLRDIVPSLSPRDAARLTNFYLSNHLAKRDMVMGRITVTHGAYLEPETIRKALAMMQA